MRCDHRLAGSSLTLAAVISLAVLSSCGSAPKSSPPSDSEGSPAGGSDAGSPSSGSTAAGSPRTDGGAPRPSAARTDGPIQATTLRDVRGLPEPLPGYPSWLRLGGAASLPEGVSSPHLAAHQTFVSVPNPETEKYKVGKELPVPAEAGTVIAREAKKPGEGFISRLDAMKKGPGGWEFGAFERAGAGEPFRESAADLAACSACHAKGGTSDSVFSSRKLTE
jgi:hypothetical protein